MFFRLGENWQPCHERLPETSGGPYECTGETPDNLGIFYAPDDKLVGTLEFYADPKVIRMVSSYEAKAEPAPKDMVDWLQQNPRLEVDEPEDATVGGVKGEQLDVVASRVPQEYYSCKQPPCLPLLQSTVDPELYLVLAETEKARFLVLEDVDGKRVVFPSSPQKRSSSTSSCPRHRRCSRPWSGKACEPAPGYPIHWSAWKGCSLKVAL
jgi:hypothetical protein